MADALSTMPVEVLHMIANQLMNVRDLKSLTEISKSVRSAVLALFWRSVEISPRSEFYLHELPAASLLRGPLDYTRNLSFQSEFHQHTFMRCPHISVEDDDQEEFSHLTLTTEAITNRVPRGQMQSFRWNLGTCVPEGILGPLGVIPLWHPTLQSLSLTTSCDCNGREDHIFPNHQGCVIDLDRLRELRRLCWKAPRREDVDVLSSAIRNNSQHLKSLELDFVDWENLDLRYDAAFNWIDSIETARDCCTFSTRILRLPSGPTRSLLLFPDLQELSLSGIPIGTDLAKAIDITELRSLTLRRCFGWHLFLARVIDQGIDVRRLKTLEVQDLSHVSSTSAGKQVLARFLDTFKGLERLSVSHVCPSIPEPDLWAHAAGHRDTLRRYVQHERIYTGIDGPIWPCELDSPRLGIPNARFRTIQEDVSSNRLGSLNLECIGLACTPERMKPILLPFVPKSCLKLIHIRQSAQDTRYRPWWAWERILEPTDKHFQGNALDFSVSFAKPNESIRKRWRLRRQLLGFVEWAFGSNGLDSLQFVVFGDFAHGGREKESQVCFCRSREAGTFVEITRDDSRWKLMAREYRDVLEACPSETLLSIS